MNKIYFLILSGILLFTSCQVMNSSISNYVNAEMYQPCSDIQCDTGEIRIVNVNWRFGKVTIAQSDDSTLHIRELEMNLPQSQQMHYWIDGSTLMIQACESDIMTNDRDYSKNLIIEVPQNVRLIVHTYKATIQADSLRLIHADFSTFQAHIRAKYLSCSENAVMRCENGGVDIGNLWVKSVTIENESAFIKVGVRQCGDARFIANYNDIDLTVPKGLDATIYCGAGRGSYTGKERYGDGRYSWTLGTITGNITITEAD